MSKDITNMTTEEINSERSELEPMVILMRDLDIDEHDGINYYNIANRYSRLCKESVLRSFLNKNKDE